jgi:hypothetical protein
MLFAFIRWDSRYSDSLRAGRSGDRFPVGARFSEPVQTGPETYPASCTMGNVSFPGVKRPGRGVDHPPSSSARVKESRAIPLLNFGAFVACSRENILFGGMKYSSPKRTATVQKFHHYPEISSMADRVFLSLFN